MKSFRQALKYMWPYRGRIGLGVLAAIGVSMLFTVTIGMIAPIVQVITSREGLSGWVYRANVESRLGVKFNPPDDPTQSKEEYLVPILLSVEDDSPAAKAGLAKLDRIARLNGRPAEDLAAFARELALVRAPQRIELTIRRPSAEAPVAPLVVQVPATSWTRRRVERVVGWLPRGNSRADRLWCLGYILTGLMAITMLKNALRFIKDVLVRSSGTRAIIDIRNDAYHHVTMLPLSHFARNGINDTISRLYQDTGQVKVGFVTLFGKTIQEPMRAGTCLIAAIVLEWRVALVSLTVLPLTAIIIHKFGKKMRRAARRALIGIAQLLAVLEETLFGLRVVKAYTMEGHERRRFFRVQRRLLKEQLRMIRIDSSVSPLLETLGFFAMTWAILLAALLVLRQQLDLKILIVQLGLLAAIADSMRKLSNVNNRLQQADAAAERVFQLLHAEPEPAGRDLPRLGPLVNELLFEDIRFRYPDTETDVLRDVSMSARAGQIVAVVGPNGSGKTTLLSLLPRFFDPDRGRVLWDGRDIRQVNLRSLRQQIGLVTQDPVIFADTVEANIRYGNRRVSREQVVAAARQAYADEFISQMPEGYDSIIGEHGATLSGGQKQRLALARAILRDPSVLILDEAMSQVDAESEMKIQKVLDEFLVGRTAFVIAHRFSTVRQAHKIVVMDAGRVVGTGGHEALMDSCPLYQTLYHTQFREAGERPAPADSADNA